VGQECSQGQGRVQGVDQAKTIRLGSGLRSGTGQHSKMIECKSKRTASTGATLGSMRLLALEHAATPTNLKVSRTHMQNAGRKRVRA